VLLIISLVKLTDLDILFDKEATMLKSTKTVLNRLMITGALCASFATTSVYATPIVNSYGLDTPGSVVTFSELPIADGAIVTNQFDAFGVTMTPGHTYNSQGNSNIFPGIDGDYVGVSQGVPFQIVFGETVSSAAFGYAKNPTTVLIEAMLGSVVVESFTQAVHYNVAGTSFLGFENILFDRIQVTANVGEGLVDNIQFTAASVPEPATIALLGLGLAGFGFAQRKQNKA